MFRFNQKKANREADEVKKLLSIMKGMNNRNQNNVSYLKEAEDPTLNIPTDTIENNPLNDVNKTPEEMANTDEQNTFETATDNSEVTEMSDKIVKAKKYDGKLTFIYDIDKEEPTITIEEIDLDDKVIGTIQKIKEYYKTWKEEKKKK